MLISLDALAWLVIAAIALTVIAPLVIGFLWIKDWLKNQLW